MEPTAPQTPQPTAPSFPPQPQQPNGAQPMSYAPALPMNQPGQPVYNPAYNMPQGVMTTYAYPLPGLPPPNLPPQTNQTFSPIITPPPQGSFGQYAPQQSFAPSVGPPQYQPMMYPPATQWQAPPYPYIQPAATGSSLQSMPPEIVPVVPATIPGSFPPSQPLAIPPYPSDAQIASSLNPSSPSPQGDAGQYPPQGDAGQSPQQSQLSSERENERAELDKLTRKLATVQLPPDLAEKTSSMLNRLALSFKYGGHLAGFDQVANYIDWIVDLPWTKRSTDTIDMAQAKTILDKHHYGLPEIKDRIIEYLSVMKLNMQQAADDPAGGNHHLMRAPVLFFVGLAGTGKTTIAISIAEAMGRSFVRIPFGGMGSALDLRGESRVHPDAEVGLVIKALRRAGTKNPVILLDELDRVAEHARSDIMGVLIELLDPGQNMAFVDHYIDYPFDLSEVLFVATANNTGNISTAVMDRLEPIQMPSYTDEEKIIIAKTYVFPKMRLDAGLTEKYLHVDEDVWPLVIRPLGFDSGIRTLERTINGMCRKVARMIVSGQTQSVRVTSQNVKQFLPTW